MGTCKVGLSAFWRIVLERASEPKAHELGFLLLFLKKKGLVKGGLGLNRYLTVDLLC